MSQLRLRRGDVVNPRSREKNGGFDPGRIWRRIDDHHVQVITTGQHVLIYRDEDLVLRNDYKGRWLNPGDWRNRHGKKRKWYAMTSMRRLKNNAKEFNPHFGGVDRHGNAWTRQERLEALADREAVSDTHHD